MLSFDIEPRVGYLYVAASGVLELGEAEAKFTEVIAIAARLKQAKILIDCTRLTGDWTPADRYAFGSYLASEVERRASQFPALPRIAIYAVAPLLDPNRYTQTVATNRGAQVRASDSLQELLSWLGV